MGSKEGFDWFDSLIVAFNGKERGGWGEFGNFFEFCIRLRDSFDAGYVFAFDGATLLNGLRDSDL